MSRHPDTLTLAAKHWGIRSHLPTGGVCVAGCAHSCSSNYAFRQQCRRRCGERGVLSPFGRRRGTPPSEGLCGRGYAAYPRPRIDFLFASLEGSGKDTALLCPVLIAYPPAMLMDISGRGAWTTDGEQRCGRHRLGRGGRGSHFCEVPPGFFAEGR